MEPRTWTPRQRIEREYRSLIKRLLDQYLALPDYATLGQINEALVNFSSVTKLFQEAAFSIASRMATQVKVSNARSWKEAARKGSKGLQIYRALEQEMETGIGDRVREIVSQNAQLISSIPEQLREQVNREIYQSEMSGARPEAIAQYLKKRIPQLTNSRAALIARTETSKSAMALTQARAEELNLHWYVWATSEDARVRRSHRIMDKVLVNWDSPPNPEKLVGEKANHGAYNAGGIFNCRCDAYPLLDVRDVKWPRQVFWRGRIQMMRLTVFRNLA